MYRLEKAELSDYQKLANISTESGKPDFELLQKSVMTRLIINGELIALAGYKDLWLPDKHGDKHEWRVLSCVFRRDLYRYTKTIVIAGQEYLKSIGEKPIVAVAVKGNEVFERFISFMGFNDTKELVKDEETGIIYEMYTR